MDPTMHILGVASQVAMGISLAACAGLRAFLPLLVVGVAGRLDWIPLTSYFEWLASTPALLVFGVAVAVELVGDQIPWVNNALDSLQTFVKPVAGVIVTAAVLADLTPLQSTVLALILGAGTAGAIHVSKSTLRLGTNLATGGVANPLAATVEEGSAWTLAAVAVWLPFAALTIVLVASGTLVWFVLQRRRRPRPA